MNIRTRYKQVAYEEAKSLRSRGFSYAEIAKICTISPSTVHAWFAHEAFSVVVKERNQARAAKENKVRIGVINKARKKERGLQYAAVVKMAETEFKHYKLSPLFIAGLMLYVSEGDNSASNIIRMANSRPELHAIFIKFLNEFLGVEKVSIRFWLLLYPDLDEVVCMKHWIKKTGLSAGQFYKNQVIIGRSKKRTLQFGVGNTIITSALQKKRLMRWIELAMRELKN